MLASLRHALDSWIARGFFLLLVGAFIFWGIGAGVFQQYAGPPPAATVGGQRIELPAITSVYQREITRYIQASGQSQPDPAVRQGLAARAIDQVTTDAAIAAAVRRLGLSASVAEIRSTVFALPAFKGAAGHFDRTQMLQVLQQNGYTEVSFAATVRADLERGQLLEAGVVGATSADTLTRAIYIFQHETRTADAVTLPFAAAAPPAPPTATDLMRWYENHKGRYTAPAYRRIQAVVLTPAIVAKEIAVSEAEIKSAYDAARAQYDLPEKRSVEVVVAPTKAKAQALATAWSGGADWPAMQKQAAAAGATATALPNAGRNEFPDPALAGAVFGAAQDAVVGPVAGAGGWRVLKVTAITPAQITPLAAVAPALRAAIAARRAADLIDQRAGKVDDLLGTGTPLSKLPANLGLAAVSGTLDAKGLTMAGTPAPIPGSAALRTALIAAAFTAHPGDPPQLVEAPGGTGAGRSYFALSVEKITPPTLRPYASVAGQVRKDWTADAMRHEQEAAAAKVLAAVKGGATLSAAVAAAPGGLAVHRLPEVSRAGMAGVPQPLIAPLFATRLGQPTMAETANGFTVAQIVAIHDPNPTADPLGFGQYRDTLTRAIQQDMQGLFIEALARAAKVRITAGLVGQIARTP